mmetsp:Transcript_42499/g.121127  ORF Transcript_42499/g.121127 Transcript_42499/m.121127 type:complete len:200 (+) Transcript_42499:41-640(+)
MHGGAGRSSGRRRPAAAWAAVLAAAASLHVLRRDSALVAPAGGQPWRPPPDRGASRLARAGAVRGKEAVGVDGFSPRAAAPVSGDVGLDDALERQPRSRPPSGNTARRRTGARDSRVQELTEMDVGSKALPAAAAVVLTLAVLAAVGFGVIGGLKEAAKERRALDPPAAVSPAGNPAMRAQLGYPQVQAEASAPENAAT